MSKTNHFIWIIVLSVVVVSLGDDKNQSRKRQLQQFLLESEEDVAQKREDTFNITYKSSRPKFDPRWFTALSKIARVRTADGRSLNISEDAKREQNGQKKVDYLTEAFSKRKLEFEKNKDGSAVSSVHFRPRKFRCQPIEDMHVSKVNRMLPAYMCKLGSRHFVLTSERFLHDRRSHVDVNIDEATFSRLSTGVKATNYSSAEFIPATLVFNKEQNDYGIKRT